MLTLPTATQRLNRQINKAEESVDKALLTVSALISEVVTTRSAFRRHEAVGHAQPALLRLQKAQSDLIAAQGEISRSHGELRKALTIVAGPDDSECPEMAPAFAETDTAAAA